MERGCAVGNSHTVLRADVGSEGLLKLFDFGPKHKGGAAEDAGEDLEQLGLERAMHGWQIDKRNFHSCPRDTEVDLSSRAGTPATMVCGATSRVTTLPAPTMAPSPMVMPHRIVLPVPMEAPRLTTVETTCQSASVC